MSDTRIKDATGSGYGARVDMNNRLQTRAASLGMADQRGLDGYGYTLNTGNITLTDGSESAVAYLKYTGSLRLHVDAVVVGIGALSGTVSNVAYLTGVRNPTGGTVISGASPGDMNINRNFGSANSLSADFYKGAQGNTVTGGEDGLFAHLNGSSRIFAPTNFVLAPQASIGINAQLNSTGGGVLFVSFVCYEEED